MKISLLFCIGQVMLAASFVLIGGVVAEVLGPAPIAVIPPTLIAMASALYIMIAGLKESKV